tara:strand:- start:16878 stop:17228 length:351 start_codon:yes stop_codon:yes gene_type:complete
MRLTRRELSKMVRQVMTEGWSDLDDYYERNPSGSEEHFEDLKSERGSQDSDSGGIFRYSIERWWVPDIDDAIVESQDLDLSIIVRGDIQIIGTKDGISVFLMRNGINFEEFRLVSV